MSADPARLMRFVLEMRQAGVTDARVLAATLNKGQDVSYALGEGRHAYLALAKGSAKVNGIELGPRDGAAISAEDAIRIEASDDAEIVLVDAPQI